jgi:hypothetical protein
MGSIITYPVMEPTNVTISLMGRQELFSGFVVLSKLFMVYTAEEMSTGLHVSILSKRGYKYSMPITRSPKPRAK